MTTTRKLIDVPKILAVLDAEKHLVHGSLVTAVHDGYCAPLTSTLLTHAYPEPGPLAVANCEHIGRCAMGSLLYASGMISYYDLAATSGDSGEWPLAIVKVLYDSYGLQRYHAQRIIDSNDSGSDGEDEPTVTARRQRVKERVRWLAERQASDPSSDFDLCVENEQRVADWYDEGAIDTDERFEQLGLQGEREPL